MPESTRDVLLQGLRYHGLQEYAAPIEQYMALLKKWNRAYNLIAEADDKTLLSRHIFDSLSVRDSIAGERAMDVGTGAGLPGLLLAVTMPAREWTLLDANGKKTRFCEQAVMELGLKNVTVMQQRIEHHRPPHCYDTIISRAFAPLTGFIRAVRHLLCDSGRMVAMKGKMDAAEQAAARQAQLRMQLIPLQVYGGIGQRHVMVLD